MSNQSEDTTERVEFRRAVAARSHDFWAGALSTIKEDAMRSWCASLIWWNHIKEAKEDSLLFQYMDEFKFEVILPIEELEKTMNSIGLIAPPLIMTDIEKRRMENRTTHSARKQSPKI